MIFRPLFAHGQGLKLVTARSHSHYLPGRAGCRTFARTHRMPRSSSIRRARRGGRLAPGGVAVSSPRLNCTDCSANIRSWSTRRGPAVHHCTPRCTKPLTGALRSRWFGNWSAWAHGEPCRTHRANVPWTWPKEAKLKSARCPCSGAATECAPRRPPEDSIELSCGHSRAGGRTSATVRLAATRVGAAARDGSRPDLVPGSGDGWRICL